MQAAFSCISEKDGAVFAWGSLGVGILIIIVGLLILIFSVALAFPVLRGQGHGWRLALAVSNKAQITGRGPGVVVIIALIGLALIVGAGYVGYLWMDDFLNKYTISFNTGEVPTTLGEVKERYQSTTNVTTKLSAECSEFRIEGKFEGACATDLLQSICRQYDSNMSCNKTEQVFEISQCRTH